MNIPETSQVIFTDSEGTPVTGGNTELILGIPTKNNTPTLSIPFGYKASTFADGKGNLLCSMDSKILDSLEKFEKELLEKAKELDIMTDVTRLNTSIRTFNKKKYIQLKTNSYTKYQIFKDGKATATDCNAVLKDSSAIISAKLYLWKFPIADKKTIGISFIADEVTLLGQVKKPSKKRVLKTLQYLQVPKKGKMMEHKEMEDVNL